MGSFLKNCECLDTSFKKTIHGESCQGSLWMVPVMILITRNPHLIWSLLPRVNAAIQLWIKSPMEIHGNAPLRVGVPETAFRRCDARIGRALSATPHSVLLLPMLVLHWNGRVSRAAVLLPVRWTASLRICFPFHHPSCYCHSSPGFTNSSNFDEI
jgi:hypothetical protein